MHVADDSSVTSQSRLRDDLTALDLPTDFPRPPVSSFVRLQESADLDLGSYDGLQRFCLAEGIGLFEALLTALAGLLLRYTGQDDVLIGSALPGGDPVALRLDLSGNPDGRRLFRQVQQSVREAADHGEGPHGDGLWKVLHDQNKLGAHVFEVMLLQTDLSPEETGSSRLPVQWNARDEYSARCDLALLWAPGPNGLHLTLDYDAELFLPATIRRLLANYQTLLESLIKAPDFPITRLPLLSASEQEQLLVRWNQTDAVFSGHACVHYLFEDQARRAADDIAVVASDGVLTYRELNRRANQIAHQLRDLGIGPETPVGICIERSGAMVAAVLGVMKAGGAYVPLIPDAPGERSAFQLKDAGASLLLTQRSLLDRMGDLPVKAICVDEWPELDQASAENLPPLATGANLAYIIFTSGSTGQPKGVLVEHSGLCNLVEAMIRYFELGPESRVLQFASLAFDGAALELGLALGGGGTLYVPQRDQTLPGPVLAEFLGEHRITMALLTPSALAAMPTHDFVELRNLVSVGEDCPADIIETWAPGRRFHNGYGPTETTIGATVGLCVDATRPSMIGRTIANKRSYILDPHLNPVPIGVPGELYIGGAGVARGYVNRPDLTAEKFISDPFGSEPGGRLYKTGDLVRYDPDGKIRFFGRLDQQLKVRGFRIEPGEIEAALKQHPAIKDALVTKRETGRHHKQLVAYVVPRAGQAQDAGQLALFLRTRLPEYMIPTSIVALASLPVARTGKVDLRALPPPDEAHSSAEKEPALPMTSREQVLAAIWARALQLDRVKREDNFFELGGSSLQVSQVVADVRAAFGAGIQLHHVFEATSLAELAGTIEKLNDAPSAPIVPRSDVSPAPMSFGQQRLWFLYLMEPTSPLYNIYAALRLGGSLDAAVLERSFYAVIQRHESLRTRFPMIEGEPQQSVESRVSQGWAEIDLQGFPSEQREAECARLITEETRRHFDLASGPLIRGTLVRLGKQEHVLVLNMHHIVSDGWSMTVFVRELGIVYQAFKAGQPSPLPAPRIQYADYARWQREVETEVGERHLTYWRERLLNAPQVLELPADRQRPAVESHRGARQSLPASAELASALRAFSGRAGATPFITCLAAFVALLHRYTGQEDLLVGSPISYRSEAETRELIGFFVNTLVLRARPLPQQSFRELLEQVRATCLGAYQHQYLPFERLVEELQPERDLSRHPLVQVFFSYENAREHRVDLPGLTVSRLEVDNRTAKVDLTVVVSEEANGLMITAEYSTDLFDVSTVTHLLEHFRLLLESAVADPNFSISALPLLTREEERRLMEWGQVGKAQAVAACIHEIFEAQVWRRPESIAATWEGQSLTYQALDDRAGQVARLLASRGAGPEARVGLYVERSPDMLVGLLGILKAGAAYVPCDPAWPRERLRWVLEDAGTGLILTQQALRGALPPIAADVICLDADCKPSEEIPRVAPRRPLPDNLAYIMYTSGSTGQPKGVAVSHRAVVSLLEAMRSLIGFNVGDTLLAVTTLSFDIASAELLLPLCAGGRVVISSRSAAADGVALAALVADSGATALQATPATWRMLLDARWRGSPGLAMLCGGEALPRGLAGRLLPKGAALWNFYGPTETTIWSCAERVMPGTDAVPIGRPLANTEVCILDRHGRPVPPGLPGELYIGGVSLARGYLNRADETAARFAPHPDGDAPGMRLYRTGDLARYQIDGKIVFLGRSDRQIKLRGHRIELGEIEEALNAHPSIRSAAAAIQVVREDDMRLVAYVVLQDGHQATAGVLRDYLAQRLPDYMLPAAFVFPDKLPLTANGKIDYRSLQAPDFLLATQQVYVPPANAIEEVVARTWASVLSVERVGRDDNFFSLGGHSLLAARMVARLSAALHMDVALQHVFEAPTVARFAQAMLADEPAPGHLERVADLLEEIRAMPPEEKRQLLEVIRQERSDQ